MGANPHRAPHPQTINGQSGAHDRVLVLDYNARYMEAVDQLAIWVRSGQISSREHILDGMDHAPGAIEMLYRGENTGKLLIKVD